MKCGRRTSRTGSKQDISPIVMRNIRQTFLCSPLLFAPAPHRTARPLAAYAVRPTHPLYSSILAKISLSLKRKYSYKNPVRKREIERKEKGKKKKKPTYVLSNFNRITSPPRQQNPITRLDRSRYNTSLFIPRARSDGDHSRFRERTRRGRTREENSRCRFLNLFQAVIHIKKKEKKKREKHTVSGLKRWTRTRSKRGTRDRIDLNVAWAAEAFKIQKGMRLVIERQKEILAYHDAI